jgi:hypothetical protein
MRRLRAARVPEAGRAAIAWGRRAGVAPFLLAAAALVPAPAAGAAGVVGVPSLCLFHHLSGLPCPGCGMTRSLVCCAHGAWADAIAFHPLGPLVFAGLVIVALARLTRPQNRLPARGAEAVMTVGVALLLVVWLARLCGLLAPPP